MIAIFYAQHIILQYQECITANEVVFIKCDSFFSIHSHDNDQTEKKKFQKKYMWKSLGLISVGRIKKTIISCMFIVYKLAHIMEATRARKTYLLWERYDIILTPKPILNNHCTLFQKTACH